MSKIQAILAKMTEVDPKRDETIHDKSYKTRLIAAVGELSEDDWNKLGDPAQDWYNDAADRVNANKDLPAWPDADPPKDEVKPRTRTRTSEKDETPAESSKAYAPAKGDKVKVVTKRGKEYVGKVLDPDDKGELVLLVGDEEVGVDLERIETIALADAPAAPAEGRRRRASDDDEPAVVEPEVSDTVELKTKRGKVVVGNIVEIDDKIVVIKDPAGDETEFDKDRVESIVVRVKNAGRGSGEVKGDAGKKDDTGKGEGETKTRRSTKSEDGTSPTLRARELMCDDPSATKEAIGAALKKEGHEVKDNTLNLIYSDVHRVFKLLRERKLMK